MRERSTQSNLKDVLAVFQLDESRVRFILLSEEDLRDLVSITDAALGRTRLSADTDTAVSAPQTSRTRLITARTIARLKTQPRAAEVLADPQARLAARITRAAAVSRTPAVVASVLARARARRALARARLRALVTADERPAALGRASGVEATGKTAAARPGTLVVAVQPSAARLLARDLVGSLITSAINSTSEVVVVTMFRTQ